MTELQRRVWASGDFNQIARQTTSVGETLVAAVDPRPNERVLDIACGSGNAALVAARRYCIVTGIDYVLGLIERARMRAEAEGTTIDFRVADAQQLPFADGSFDAIVSVFGVMFAADQEKAAREMLRVTKPGGRIGLATWMPEGLVSEFFETQTRYLPPPAELAPPFRWGTDDGLTQLLGDGARPFAKERCTLNQYYPSVAEAVQIFVTYFGPCTQTFASLDAKGQAAFRADLTALFAKYNRATDGTAMLEARYLQTVVIRA